MIYDITRTVTPRLPVWPGDTPYSLKPAMQMSAGDSVNLMTLQATAHLGTHADAYYHYVADGLSVAEMPLEAYIGRARVVTVDVMDGPLMPDDLGDIGDAVRVLIRSHVSMIDDVWPQQFPYLSVPLIHWLAGRGVCLVGLDSPSVDAFDSADLPCHRALYQHKMVNLEMVYLRGIPDGEYELVALPLKLLGACGSPVRAVLRTLD